MNLWMYDFDLDYEHDFSFLNAGEQFPNKRMLAKNAEYKFRRKQYGGKYGNGRNMIVMINKIEKEIPYKVLSLNYYKLLSNKLIDLIFNNEIVIKTNTKENDVALNKIIEKTKWLDSIRKAIKYCTIYGDSYIKTYKQGASVFSPNYAFKIVADNDVNSVLAYVLYQPIKVKEFGEIKVKYIRFEIHFDGQIFEIVKEYSGTYSDYLSFGGGSLGNSVDYTYKGRKISKDGNWYSTGVTDASMVQCMSTGVEPENIYGTSPYVDIQDIVTALEQRISAEHHGLNSLADPLLIVGMSSVEELEDGTYRLKTVNGNMLVTEDRNNDKAIVPQQFQQDMKLDSYETFINQLKSELYELSELGRVFLSSEYSGNISEESISNLIKGAIDKANRVLTDVYYEVVDSLYVLARTNGLELNKEDLNINFNIGQTDNDKNVAEVCQILSSCKILSRQTLREKYFGYSEDQSIVEQRQIDIEDGLDTEDTQQNEEIEEQTDKLVNRSIENFNL